MALLASLVWVAAVAGCSAGRLRAQRGHPYGRSVPAPPTPAAGSRGRRTLATGLDTPWGLVALADGTLLVSERDTRQILHLDGDRRTTVATIEAAEPAGEGGLLGLAASADATTRVRLLHRC